MQRLRNIGTGAWVVIIVEVLLMGLCIAGIYYVSKMERPPVTFKPPPSPSPVQMLFKENEPVLTFLIKGELLDFREHEIPKRWR